MANPVNFAKKLGDFGQWLDGNKAINGITDSFGNIFGSGKVDGEGILTAIKRAHTVDNSLADGYKYSKGKIATSAIAAGAAARIATGGGIYKDGNGNTNLIGIPFV